MSLREEEIRNHELFKSLKIWLTTGIITERNFEEIEKVIFYFVEQERQAKDKMIDEAVRNFATELIEHHKIHLPLTIEYSYLTINTLLKDRGVKKISERL